MRKLFGGAAVLAAVALAAVALTGFRGGCGAHRHGYSHDPAQVAAFVSDRVDDALDDVDATPEQRTRIHAIKDRMLAAGQDLHAGKAETGAAFLAEWKAEAPDREKLHALVDARADAYRQLAHQAVDAGIEAHGVLTPAQREKLTKKVERWHR